MKRAIVLLGVVVSLTGCVSAAVIRSFDEHAPIALTAKSRPIMFKRLISTIPKDQKVGVIQEGLACVGQSEMRWARTGQLDVIAERNYFDRLREEFLAAGYVVIGEPSDVTPARLFDDPDASQAEFLIGGVIIHAAWNLCYPFAGFGNTATSSGEASIEVEWHIYDRDAKAVALTVTTGGSARTESGSDGGPKAIFDAFGAAVRNLLANDEFAFMLAPLGAKPHP